MHGQQNIKKVI